VSVEPPGPKPTSILSGPSGAHSASAGIAETVMPTAVTALNNILVNFILVLLIVLLTPDISGFL
jgi:hypothetical protein